MITELRRRLGQGSVAMVAALALTMPATGTAVAATPTTAPATVANAIPAETTMQAAAGGWSIRTVDRCTGTRIRHKPIKAGRTTVGWVNVYRGSGKRKCARVIHAGPTWGKARDTEVIVWHTAYGMASSGGTARYKSAGILARGIGCINVRGTIYWNGKTRGKEVHRVCTS
ncbi:hypothetical protein [Myceligenerans pegani]|uniref:Secreted protein n=1 Tax=Myceligenerans pegani TaxID=2776917 RepID=A0ABR9N5Y7_9MICO|nr:hypothetical protein [Myceligenerans sp. TRM 65318]MBE1878681.1 hypothetical protein [Myceligenerans sp. TRM 65318]MBE3020952.1 hypothetical protein [Myceligenerans sp. TRM 65318]